METEIDEIIDIEEFSKNGEKPPRATRYRIKVDGTPYVVKVPTMTGRELLVLAGKNPPEQYQIFQKLRGGHLEEVKLNEKTDFTRIGVEKFVTLPLDQTEGYTRREFVLNDNDVQELEALGLPWEAVRGSPLGRVIIHNFPVPPGYTTDKVELNLVIEPAYPETQIDMVYFFPALIRADGKAINALAEDHFDGKCWQRWSRHRTGQNPWRPNVDNICTHLKLVEFWLKKELSA